MQDALTLRFARHGMALLLAGLLTGFVVGGLHSHHVANGAHVTALIAGFGLVAVGWLWPRLQLGPRWSEAGAWTFIVSMHLSWLGLIVKAALGRGPDTPAAIPVASTAPWDAASLVILMVASLASVVAVVIALVGLRPAKGPRAS
ncbi:MAG: hypothetical protein JF588_07575 [Caulobacterales bacterium]|nr:hypothetical protein [Caulobacterales bacterium]